MPLGIVQAIPGNSLMPGPVHFCKIFSRMLESKFFVQGLAMVIDFCPSSVGLPCLNMTRVETRGLNSPLRLA